MFKILLFLKRRHSRL